MKYLFILGICLNFLLANTIASQVVIVANKHIGNPYVWGGNNLQSGVDCSSFVQLIYAKYGVKLPRTAKEQALNTKKYKTIDQLKNIKIGDALYFKNNHGHIHHVAIVTGFNINNIPIITHAKGKEFGIVKEIISNKYILEFIGAKRFSSIAINKRKVLRPLILK